MPSTHRAFVIMPFGKKKAPDGTVIDFDAVYEGLFAPAITGAGLTPHRADADRRGGSIHLDMFQDLLPAEFVVADLTSDNPNVWYEIGVALDAGWLAQAQSGSRENVRIWVEPCGLDATAARGSSTGRRRGHVDGLPGSRCESAPKRDPTSDRPQLLDLSSRFCFRRGPDRRRSGPRTSGVFADDFIDLLLFWPGSRFGADSQPNANKALTEFRHAQKRHCTTPCSRPWTGYRPGSGRLLPAAPRGRVPALHERSSAAKPWPAPASTRRSRFATRSMP
jgi:hypothetical protein